MIRSPDFRARLVQLGAVAALLLAWDIITQNRLVNQILLPPLRGVFWKFVALLRTSDLYNHLVVTLMELIAGFAIAAALGLSIGYLIGRSRHAAKVFEPLIASVFAVPLVIFLPIFLLFFGIGPSSKIAFGATYAFFPIALNTIGGIAQVDQRYVRVARAMGASDWQTFRRVLAPAALPVIVTGLRIGCIIGFLSIIGSEMIAGLEGLGSQIVRLGEGMNTADMFAWIVFVIILAVALNTGLTALERRFAIPGSAR